MAAQPSGPRSGGLRAVRAACLLAALGAGAWLLSRRALPEGLVLPDLDARAVFGAELVARAERYERFLDLTRAAGELAVLAALALYARRGAALARESAAGPIGTGMLLGMLGLAIAWLAGVPFSLAALWWERRHGVSEMGYLEWLVHDWALLGGEFLSVSLALLVVMGLARRLGERWWLPGAAVFVAIAALFTLATPYLADTTEPLRARALAAAAERYERALGLGDIPVRVEEVSDETEQANAYAYGIGPSRRVVLWDTILQEPFSPAEQRVVLAHELAHLAQGHLPEGLAWFALFAAPGAWLLMRATRRRGGLGEPRAVPLALLVAACLQLAASPAGAWISRGMEAEADWVALETTRDPDALEGLMRGFATTSLADPDPPRWAHLLWGTHPTLEERVALARAWRAARRGGP